MFVSFIRDFVKERVGFRKGVEELEQMKTPGAVEEENDDFTDGWKAIQRVKEKDTVKTKSQRE